MTRVTWLLLVALATGCGGKAPLPPVSGQTSAPGWEVRYNAALALARRGSERMTDPGVQELINEMLTEELQLRNFRVTLKGGQETPDPAAARTAIFGALKALDEYHAKKGAAGLMPFRPALEKLTSSTTPALGRAAQDLVQKIDAK